MRRLERQGHGFRRDRRELRLAPGTVDDARVERFTLAPPEHVQQVRDAPVGAGQGTADLIGLEQDKVHGSSVRA